jgi:hypothetical protein
MTAYHDPATHLADARLIAMREAILVILAMLPDNMELTFYRDDSEPAALEVQYPNGHVDVYVSADRPERPTIREVC